MSYWLVQNYLWFTLHFSLKKIRITFTSFKRNGKMFLEKICTNVLLLLIFWDNALRKLPKSEQDEQIEKNHGEYMRAFSIIQGGGHTDLKTKQNRLHWRRRN